MINDFDLRQFSQMKSLVDLLQKRQIDVSKFVSDQWALVEMLQSTDEKWKNEYFHLVNVIEDLYATALDRGQKQMEQKDIQIIDETLKKMLILLRSQDI